MSLFDFSQSPSLGWVVAAAAAGTAILPQVRAAWTSLFSLLVVQVSLSEEGTARFMEHAWKTLRPTRLGIPHYTIFQEFIRPKGRWGPVAIRLIGSATTTVFFRGVFPVMVTGRRADHRSAEGHDATRVAFIRGTFDFQRFFREAVDTQDTAKAKQERRFYVRRVMGTQGTSTPPQQGPESLQPSSSVGVTGGQYLGWAEEDIGLESPAEPFANLAYPQEVLDAVEKVRRWVESRTWCKQRGLLWRLGVLFYGEPGTGKTSCARAIGETFDIPIHRYDLTTMSNLELSNAWQSSRSAMPVIVLLEDLDRTFERDASGKTRTPVTLDALLNCIAGVEPSEGILLIATANEPSKLSKALGIPVLASGPSVPEARKSTRPGRFDLCVHVGPLEREQREVVARRILVDCPSLIARTVEEGEGETGAQFTHRCSEVALAHHWEAQPTAVPPHRLAA